jgi:hypothetical protein
LVASPQLEVLLVSVALAAMPERVDLRASVVPVREGPRARAATLGSEEAAVQALEVAARALEVAVQALEAAVQALEAAVPMPVASASLS